MTLSEVMKLSGHEVLLEKVHHWEQTPRVYRLASFPKWSLLPVCVWGVISQLPILVTKCYAPPIIMWTLFMER